MQQPLGQTTRMSALDAASLDNLVEFASHDLLDLNGAHVRDIAHDTIAPDRRLVTYRDGSCLSFAQIARIIPCFTPNTLIATPDGERLAQDLRAGDRVLTRDNGIQFVTWAGQKKMTMQGISPTSDMCPIQIRKGSLGPNCPERDMVVSPNHRMLIVTTDAQKATGEAEVLIAAKNLTHLPGVTPLRVDGVTYIHFMCAHHEIVFSDGAWTETFQPNDASLHGIDAAQRIELLTLFPELARVDGRRAYGTARETLNKLDFIAA